MAGTQREDCSDEVAARRKYLRFMEVGMAIFLAWPVAVVAAGTFGLNIRCDILSVLMIMVAVVVFAIGHVGRQELEEHK